jgi:hypothetical protein
MEVTLHVKRRARRVNDFTQIDVLGSFREGSVISKMMTQKMLLHLKGLPRFQIQGPDAVDVSPSMGLFL